METERMKVCELCSHPASMYCESDRASLCWDCDEKVHSTNFLVAKHSRTLLCNNCQSPTRWIASGIKLGRTVSVCVTCVEHCNAKQETVVQRQQENQLRNEQENQLGNEQESQLGNDDEDTDLEYEDDENDTDVGGDYSDTGDDDEDEDGENQVVPWSSSPLPPPPASSSSSEELSSSRLSSGCVSGQKRRRDDADLDSEDDKGSSSPRFHRDAGTTEILSFRASEVDEVTSFRSLKVIRSERVRDQDLGEAELRTVAIVDSIKRFQQSSVAGDDNGAAMILGICKMSGVPRA